MASKVKKGFLYYIAWLAFFVVGIFCIFACVLVFNPGKDVFGINFKYVSDNHNVKIDKLDNSTNIIGYQHFNTIDVECGYSNVSVVRSTNYEVLTVFVNKKIVGFSSSDQIKYEISTTLNNNTLKVKVTEPKLSLKLSPSATITIHCPKNSSFENYALNVKTTSGYVSIGSKEDFDIKLKSLNIETQNGEINLNTKTTITSGNAIITTKTGNINVNNDVKNTLKINSDRSKIFIYNISGSLDVTANEIKAKCAKISGNVKFSSKKGYIYIDELGDISTKTNGNFTAEADSMHIANVIIGKMAGEVSLPNAESSDVQIKELWGKANIVTKSGSVKINETHNNVAIKTTSGSVNVTQMSTERTNIETYSGRVTANFAALGTQTDIITEKATITVNLADGLKGTINYAAKGNINISWITSDLEKEASIDLPLASTTNIINLKTISSGNININNGFVAE